MFVLIVPLVSLLLALLRGGKLTNMARVSIRWRGVIIAGFMLQVLVFSDFWQDSAALRAWTAGIYLFSLGLLLAAMSTNLNVPGLKLITLGFVLNLLVIALNGGYMPSAADARALAGRIPLEPGQVISNSIGMGPGTQLYFLGDIFAIPGPWLLRNVFSIGDVLIAAGAFYLVQRALVNPRTVDESH